jgi:hypothetical protein
MDEEALNLSIRKFLKGVGIGSQREIERAVATALAEHRVTDKDGPFPMTMTLRCARLGIDVTFDGDVGIAKPPRDD